MKNDSGIIFPFSGKPIDPEDRVRLFSPDEFEKFVEEWADSYKKDIEKVYTKVKKIAGPGDLGRDIICEYEDGTYDLIQCKHYEKKLGTTDMWLDIGKLCYYTYSSRMKLPKRYILVASRGISAPLYNLLSEPKKIAKRLLEAWETKCAKALCEMNDDLRVYILNFDFSIITDCGIQEILGEHKKTQHFLPTFGGGLPIERPETEAAPDEIQEFEFKYIEKILAAYSADHNKDIRVDNLNDQNLDPHFRRQRRYFFSAECLKRYTREIFLNNEFESIKKNFYDGIIEVIALTYPTAQERLGKVLIQSQGIEINSILKNVIDIEDRYGFCHHLANERADITWNR